MPDDHSQVRQVRISRTAVLLAITGMLILVLASVLYFLSVRSGSGWLPGGSRLTVENRLLLAELEQLNTRVDGLKTEMAEVFDIQEVIATAVDLEPLDAQIWEAGIGGRGPLTLYNQEIPKALAMRSSSEVGQALDKLVRQAKIQYQGYLAILDTLSSRTIVLEHIPSIRPIDTGWLSSRFGMRNDPFTGKMAFHRGVDYASPTGTPVRATADGKVIAVQQQRGLGKVLKIDHGNKVVTLYAHLHKSLVNKGDQVKRGDIVAESGNTGRSTASHLHYEIKVNGRAINPLSYILDSYASRN